MNIFFTKSAWIDYTYWQTENEKICQRINLLIKEISRNPFSGIGKPEALKQNLKGFWSRRIDLENRLVYRISGVETKQLEIISCRYHYK